MDMRVMSQRRASGVEDGGGADARAEMSGVGGEYVTSEIANFREDQAKIAALAAGAT